MNSMILAGLLVLLVTGCGKQDIKLLKAAITRSTINQNLQNGKIPSPKDVQKNSVTSVTDRCQEFKHNLPDSWQQGTILVPEDPSKPEGRKLNIFYYGKISPNHTPIVFFNGGPGADSHSSYHVLGKNKWMYDKPGLSFVFIDQRGNGCSDYYPQGDNEEVLKRLRFYGSRGIVSDAEMIRRKLIGDKPWIAFGQSYGAFITHRYATISPQSLKAAFAHGNAINYDSQTRKKIRIVSQLRVMEEYLKTYPDDKKIVQQLNQELTPATCFEYESDDQGTKDKACGYEIISLTSDLLGFTDSWLEVHQWLNNIVKDGRLYKDGIIFYLETFKGGGAANPLNSKKWADQVLSWVDRNVGGSCLKVQEDLLKEGIDISKNAFTECSFIANYPDWKPEVPASIQNLTKDHLTMDDFTKALKENPTLNFYLYSGQKDLYVPVETFQEELAVVQTFSNFYYTNFTGTGHDGFYSEPKVWQDLAKESY